MDTPTPENLSAERSTLADDGGGGGGCSGQSRLDWRALLFLLLLLLLLPRALPLPLPSSCGLEGACVRGRQAIQRQITKEELHSKRSKHGSKPLISPEVAINHKKKGASALDAFSHLRTNSLDSHRPHPPAEKSQLVHTS